MTKVNIDVSSIGNPDKSSFGGLSETRLVVGLLTLWGAMGIQLILMSCFVLFVWVTDHLGS